jgi:hypothetical protein
MKKELVTRLSEKYFDILDSNIRFEVNNGWYEVIKNLLHVLNHHVARTPLDGKFQIVTIKEKWGGLRVYFDNGDEFIEGAVAMAECLSNSVCEVCGAPGEKNAKGGWIKTKCKQHE